MRIIHLLAGATVSFFLAAGAPNSNFAAYEECLKAIDFGTNEYGINPNRNGNGLIFIPFGANRGSNPRVPFTKREALSVFPFKGGRNFYPTRRSGKYPDRCATHQQKREDGYSGSFGLPCFVAQLGIFHLGKVKIFCR